MSKSEDVDKMIEQLDQDTVLRVSFRGHTDQFVYRFPSGIMTTVWGDRSIPDGSIGIMSEEHVKHVLSQNEGNDPIEIIPFEESPYAEGWEK